MSRAVGDVLVVDFAALRQASGDLQVAIDAMAHHLAELERGARPLVATWEGAARSAYEQRQATWRRAAGDLALTLREIKLAVDESLADYLDTERRNVDQFH